MGTKQTPDQLKKQEQQRQQGQGGRPQASTTTASKIGQTTGQRPGQTNQTQGTGYQGPKSGDKNNRKF